MIPVLTPAEMQAVDAAADVGVEVLVERAGAEVARVARAMLGGTYGRTVVVIAGPGNNGADGLVAARLLERSGVRVIVHDPHDCPDDVGECDLVIDAAYGTGFRGTWPAPSVSETPVLAVDLPSGIDALSGDAPGAYLSAARTVTFAAAKPGHVFGVGRWATGRLEVVDIGLDVSRSSIGIVGADDAVAWFRPRAASAHKWSRAVRVVAGSPGMTGAAMLTAQAAMRTGAGIVHLSCPGLEPNGPLEVVARRVAPFDWHASVLADLHRFHALVIGPGLGREDYTAPSITAVVSEATIPVVIDGDGLFALAWNSQGAPTAVRNRTRPTVLTPHDGEFALLTGSAPGSDRIGAARQLAYDTGAVVLLKGVTTVVADPTGEIALIADADQRLATAGSGDVLAGVIATLLASGLSGFRAAALGAWVHGAAGRRCAHVGAIASDLITELPGVLGEIDRGQSRW